MKKKILLLILLFKIFIVLSQNNKKMPLEAAKLIPKQEALELIKNNQSVIDNDKSLEKSSRVEYYLIKDIGYLIIFDYLDQAAFYDSKQHYLDWMSYDPDVHIDNVDFNEVILNKEKYIEELSLTLDLKLTAKDGLEGLKPLDKKLETLHFIESHKIFKLLFAYLFTTMYNHLNAIGWKYEKEEYKDEGFIGSTFPVITIIGSDKKEYSEIFRRLWRMIFEREEETLEHIAYIIINFDKINFLKVDKR